MKTIEVRVDERNREQLLAWDGDEGAFWAAHADAFDRALAGHHPAFMAAAALTTTSRVLDVGCGNGQTTCEAARTAADGFALGVDLSAAMLACGRERAAAEGLTNVGFEQADAQIHPFAPESFDVAISRTAAMFFGDPVAALANIRTALKPGGRLILLTWQVPEENEWIGEILGALAAGRELPIPGPGAQGPFALAEPDRISEVLHSAGFANVELVGITAPMWFGEDPDDAHRFLLELFGWLLRDLDDRTRAQAEAALRRTLQDHASPDGVVYRSSTWIITADRSPAGL